MPKLQELKRKITGAVAKANQLAAEANTRGSHALERLDRPTSEILPTDELPQSLELAPAPTYAEPVANATQNRNLSELVSELKKLVHERVNAIIEVTPLIKHCVDFLFPFAEGLPNSTDEIDPKILQALAQHILFLKKAEVSNLYTPLKSIARLLSGLHDDVNASMAQWINILEQRATVSPENLEKYRAQLTELQNPSSTTAIQNPDLFCQQIQQLNIAFLLETLSLSPPANKKSKSSSITDFLDEIWSTYTQPLVTNTKEFDFRAAWNANAENEDLKVIVERRKIKKTEATPFAANTSDSLSSTPAAVTIAPTSVTTPTTTAASVPESSTQHPTAIIIAQRIKIIEEDIKSLAALSINAASQIAELESTSLEEENSPPRIIKQFVKKKLQSSKKERLDSTEEAQRTKLEYMLEFQYSAQDAIATIDSSVYKRTIDEVKRSTESIVTLQELITLECIKKAYPQHQAAKKILQEQKDKIALIQTVESTLTDLTDIANECDTLPSEELAKQSKIIFDTLQGPRKILAQPNQPDQARLPERAQHENVAIIRVVLADLRYQYAVLIAKYENWAQPKNNNFLAKLEQNSADLKKLLLNTVSEALTLLLTPEWITDQYAALAEIQQSSDIAHCQHAQQSLTVRVKVAQQLSVIKLGMAVQSDVKALSALNKIISAFTEKKIEAAQQISFSAVITFRTDEKKQRALEKALNLETMVENLIRLDHELQNWFCTYVDNQLTKLPAILQKFTNAIKQLQKAYLAIEKFPNDPEKITAFTQSVNAVLKTIPDPNTLSNLFSEASRELQELIKSQALRVTVNDDEPAKQQYADLMVSVEAQWDNAVREGRYTQDFVAQTFPQHAAYFIDAVVQFERGKETKRSANPLNFNFYIQQLKGLKHSVQQVNATNGVISYDHEMVTLTAEYVAQFQKANIAATQLLIDTIINDTNKPQRAALLTEMLMHSRDHANKSILDYVKSRGGMESIREYEAAFLRKYINVPTKLFSHVHANFLANFTVIPAESMQENPALQKYVRAINIFLMEERRKIIKDQAQCSRLISTFNNVCVDETPLEQALVALAKAKLEDIVTALPSEKGNTARFVLTILPSNATTITDPKNIATYMENILDAIAKGEKALIKSQKVMDKPSPLTRAWNAVKKQARKVKKFFSPAPDPFSAERLDARHAAACRDSEDDSRAVAPSSDVQKQQGHKRQKSGSESSSALFRPAKRQSVVARDPNHDPAEVDSPFFRSR